MAIYFILDHTGTRVKIGYTKNVSSRFASLEASNPHPITLIATFEGTYKEEWELHRKFADKHIHSEWFVFDKSMLGAFTLPPREKTEEEKQFDQRERRVFGGKWPEDRKVRWAALVAERYASKKSAQPQMEASP